MKVKFKNVETLFTCSEPVEQKLFKSGVPAGWLIVFSIYDDISSNDVDNELVSVDNISELKFINSDETEKTISGYQKIRACTIHHNDKMTVTEFQFTREGDAENAGISKND